MEIQTKQDHTAQMQLVILAFGIAKDIVGGSQINFTIKEKATVLELKKALLQQFPKFEKLVSLAIGVNGEYAEDGLVLKPSDEIVIIPPVSGG